ncbi:MOXD1 homolog 1 isoform X2 [Cryptotermes secundus]|uniref:MOXD1 homolog 1 isoform X2 n=1 Tax=Cryptotermes secundus TaxID=105785 RepID=UPI000CD7C763|nr:MOXD1 homolog 1 isoform X2 [Cryptotermes secundus]
MPSRSPALLLFVLIAVPLATIKGSSKFNNELMQDGDKVKQEKVLELLDQYVLHVDRGRTDDQTERAPDLLDQYVMHVDRGARVDLEATRGWKWDIRHQAGVQDRESRKVVLQNSKDLTRRGSRRNQIQNTTHERDGGHKWGALRATDRVRRNIHGTEKGQKDLTNPKDRLRSKHGIRARRSLRETRTVEGVAISGKRPQEYRKWNTADVMGRNPGHWSKSYVRDDGKGMAEEFIAAESRQRRNIEAGNKTADSGKETNRDLITGPWTHTVQLDDSVNLSWSVKDGGDDIEFLVEAATRGYVGVGFSPGGGMAAADIILGWVDDNTGEVYLVGDTVRVIWATQDSDPTLDGGEIVGMTWHGKEHRGVRPLHLLTPPVKKGAPHGSHTRHWDVTLQNFTIPDNMDTLYWCKIFKVPPMQKKHHMIGYEPVLQSGNEHYVHHMLLYECVAPHHFASTDSMFQRFVEHPGESCYSSAMPPEWDQCITPIVSWAVGSQGEFLPNHVGLPLADGNKARYFMLEIHYDNPKFRQVKDSSGLRIHYTKDLRQYDGGILVNGITITPLHIVPPHQLEYRTAGYCSSHCTHKTLPQTGIKLVSVVLHSHLAGKKIRVRHIREGRELPRIAEDNSYDFSYQQSRILPHEVAVLPGDELVTECVYQTPNRTEPTFGGYSTKQEMCLAFLLYYPRTQLAGCYSMTPVKYFFETFGVRQFYDVDMDTVERMILKVPIPDEQGSNRIPRSTTSTTTSTAASFPTGANGALDEEANSRAISALQQMKEFTVEAEDGDAAGSGGLFGELVISEPEEFQNRSFTSHLVELPWTEKLLTQRVEESFYAGKHMVFCRKHDDQLAIPLSITTFPKFTELPEDETKNYSHCEGKIRHSLRTGDTAASSVDGISTILFLYLAVEAVIIIQRLLQQ